MSKYLTISLMIITLIVGMGLGYILTPSYAFQDNEHVGLGKADRYLDLRYLNAMIAHHKSAMALAEEAKKYSQNSNIIALANTIVKDEVLAIRELEVWKLQWYNDSSFVDVGQFPHIGTSDKNFDLRFLNALIAHHEEGIKMAQEALGKSTRNEVLDNAFKVSGFLEGSKSTLEELRRSLYSV